MKNFPERESIPPNPQSQPADFSPPFNPSAESRLSTTCQQTSQEVKEKEMKRETFPQTPIKRKAEEKETRRGFCKKPSKTARAHASDSASYRYRLAAAATDEIIENCFGSRQRDRNFWAYFCYHHDPETIIEKAREYASLARQGEIRNPVAAFNHWLVTSYERISK